ncbi:lipopolysaccharide-induced tumor necrosis factor-alpha factor homolog isoform X2 [Fundulus heteroclitus]|uniref:lipopolysaccharide-induced tumor necrosis factor-alpha factor homolog isoform X2 n=1 Tax=Fundulus heteroclitus TaxID=8078 RepID=UPI00165ACB81|nr:lipopolysaccharide-induced tumor necrosis factor-alpha factor homolog isoform X2 [Fundulus heteroclitus]
MEKNEEPPAVTEDTPAPPYPGPPLDHNVVINQPAPEAHHNDQAVSQPVTQQCPQPDAQQCPQPVSEQCPQPVSQQHPQPAQQPVLQFVTQQNQNALPVNQIVVMQPMPTDAPGRMLCPHCQVSVVTSTEYKVGILTWTIVGVLCIFGCWPCCLIPFFVPACKDVEHSCPSCNNVLHIYKRR